MTQETLQAQPKSSPVFKGWHVVAALSLILMLNAGLCFYNLPVLLNAFVVERSFSVGISSSATSLFFVMSGISGLLAGQLVDRFDVRYVIIISASVNSVVLASVGFINERYQLYYFFGVMGLCYGCCGLVPATTLIARWFEARRALALSIASTGLSLGGVIITPLAVALIASQGLANSGIWFGMIFLVGIVPVSALILRSPPAHHLDRQHHADQRGARLSDGGSTSWRDAFRTRFFVGLTVAYIFALGAQVGTITHLYLLVSSRGLVDIASIVIATTAIASIFGRLSGAWLLLRFSNRDFTLAMLGLQAVGVVLLATAYSIPSLIFGALVFGATVGNILMLQSLLLAEAFGVREYGRIYSLSQFIGVWGVAGSPMLVGQIYEKTSNYELAYLVIAAGALIGTLSMALAGPVRRREHESA